MPVPTPQNVDSPMFPTLSRAQIDATRTSSWYETFIEITPKATYIDLESVGEKSAFLNWLEADSIFIPEDSQVLPAGPTAEPSSPISDEDQDEDTDSESEAPVYELPQLNEAIRAAIKERGGAVFPKLNWTAPRDASFILPQTAHGPLHCTSPADVYLLLKSSDFISHDLDPRRAYASGPGEDDEPEAGQEEGAGGMQVELVLKEFIEVNPSRIVRCFVRDNVLIGISQGDTNFYDHLQKADTKEMICDTVRAFWEDEMHDQHPSMGTDYIFDLYLTPKFDDALIIDINPYRPSTDTLLFSYPELHRIFLDSRQPPQNQAETENRPRLPILRVIDSPAHPDASRSAPAYGGNMMPLEMIEMSQGRSLDEFREAWQDVLARGMSE